MSSDATSEMALLLDETEYNLKLIENYGSDFAAPVLNEWRYVTRHVVGGISPQGEPTEEFQKAVGHLRRARFDSYDILLLCQFERINALRDGYGHFTSCVAKYIPDYSGWQVKIHNARRLHKSFVGDPKRDAYYDRLKHAVGELEEYIGLLEASAPDWQNDIRVMIFENRIKIAKIIGGFVVGAATVVGLFLK